MMVDIIKVYADYVVAYDKYVDRYFQTMSEDDCQFEITLCDGLYDQLNDLVNNFCNNDTDMSYDIMDILSKTEYSTKKINMAKNLRKLFEYTQITF
jgi:hypothetical protein